MGVYRNNGQEHGNYHIMMGIYRDSGIGFRVVGIVE